MHTYTHVNVLFQADLVFTLPFENSPILSLSLFDIKLSEAITVLEILPMLIVTNGFHQETSS